MRFEQLDFVGGVDLCDADLCAERPQRRRRIAAPTHAAQRRHARIVPTVDESFPYQFGEFSLRHHNMSQVETGELILSRAIARQGNSVEEPVIERTVRVEFEGANRMCYSLDCVALTVRPVVRRVNTPRVASTMMMQTPDSVHDWITQLTVRVRHINFGAKHLLAVVEFTGPHASEQV